MRKLPYLALTQHPDRECASSTQYFSKRVMMQYSCTNSVFVVYADILAWCAGQTWGVAEFLASLMDKVASQAEDRQELLYSHNTA